MVHATVVARWLKGGWRGVLVRGPSGAGKSSLALSLLREGWRLVADDRAILWASGGRLFARAPERLFGLVEARGLAVLPVPALAFAEVVLAVDLAAAPEQLDRIPEPAWERFGAVEVRRIALFAPEPSATAKLALALAAVALGAGQEPAYQAPSAEEAEAPGAARGPPMGNR